MKTSFRIVFTSDLHADLSPRNAELLTHVADRAAGLEPDVFVIAGDLAEHADEVTRSLRVFSNVGGLKLYLAGNHDLFVESRSAPSDDETSLAKFERFLPVAAAEAGFGYLGLQPARLGGLALVGVPGWYDFSLRDPTLDPVVDLEHYRRGSWRGVRAYDRGHVYWPRQGASPEPAGAFPASGKGSWAGDEEICEFMVARLDQQLNALGDAQFVLAVIHVLPFAELVVRNAFGASPFHDAYLGSASLGARLLREPRLRAVVCGHLHRPADLHIGPVRVLSRPVGDARKSPLDLEALAHASVGWFDLEAQA